MGSRALYPFSWLLQRAKSRVRGLVRAEVEATLAYALPQLLALHNGSPENRQSQRDLTRDPIAHLPRVRDICRRLRALGVPVEDVDIDISDFDQWLRDFGEVPAHYKPLGDVAIEKCLEHYLAYRHLGLSKGDVYVDVAASDSPWARILRRRGVKAYRLDLSYPRGRHGIDIGADATRSGLPAGFSTAMSAQCAFETFEGDADIRFLTEASRILSPAGRYAILPLYLDTTYFIVTSPMCDQRLVEIDAGADHVWRDDAYIEPFARHYSPESFVARVFTNLPPDMPARVIHFANVPELAAHHRGQRLYCFFMLHATKRASTERFGPDGSPPAA